MKIIQASFFFIAFFSLSFIHCVQSQQAASTLKIANSYNNCAAIIFNGKMLVDSYSPSGKCQLSEDQKGVLSVSTVELSEKGGTPKKAIEFQVAIRNTTTNTLWMYSNEKLTSIQYADILSKCQHGDRIVILTVDQEYSLTHHEIEISWTE